MAALLFPAAVQARNPCDDLPAPVQEALRAEQGWSLVRLETLLEEDRQAFLQKYPGACPGVAAGNFTGNGKPSYAVRLVAAEQNKNYEKIIVLKAQANVYEKVVVLEKTQSSFPGVLVAEKPQEYVENIFTGDDVKARRFKVSTEHFASFHMEAGGGIYYYRAGKFVYFSDSE